MTTPIKIVMTATRRTDSPKVSPARAIPLFEYNYDIVVSNADTGEELARGRLVEMESIMPRMPKFEDFI